MVKSKVCVKFHISGNNKKILANVYIKEVRNKNVDTLVEIQMPEQSCPMQFGLPWHIPTMLLFCKDVVNLRVLCSVCPMRQQILLCGSVFEVL